MRPLLLCRERLERILTVLARKGPAVSVRDFMRTYGVFAWELREAEAMGWIATETHKPRVGRPSQVVRSLSETPSAKLPPWRFDMGRTISPRHSTFALYSVYGCIQGGSKQLGLPGYVAAYLNTFRNSRSRNAAYVSTSRLLRHPDVKAARQWWYARFCGEVPREDIPETADEIWRRLSQLGCWRAKFKPRSCVFL